MIFTDRTIIVQKGISSINDTIILYRGDKGVEIRFTLNEGSPFRFGSGASPNIIEKTEAAYGQLIIKRPNDLPAIFSEIAPTNEGKIIFTITAEMIDEITEVGNYTFQIRLLDEGRNSRATLPEVIDGIEIREPIATEDVTDTNEVGVATVGYAATTAGALEDTFDSQGNYNKTTWGTGDRITAAKLNKIEAGIDGVNKKAASGGSNINDTTASATTTYSSNKIENIKANLSSQIEEIKNNGVTSSTVEASFSSWLAIGDSITVGYNNNNYSYADIIAEKYGIYMVKDAVTGSNIASQGNFGPGFVHRVDNDGINYNLVTVMGGLNDFGHATVPLGTFNPNIAMTDSISSFYDGVTILCKKLITKYPNSKIVFLSSNRDDTYNNKRGESYEQFMEAIATVCSYFSIPFYRIDALCGFNRDVYKNQGIDNGDLNTNDIHPKTLGHKKIAGAICDCINFVNPVDSWGEGTLNITQLSSTIASDASMADVRNALTVKIVYENGVEFTIIDYNITGNITEGTTTFTIDYRGITSTVTFTTGEASGTGITPVYQMPEPYVFSGRGNLKYDTGFVFFNERKAVTLQIAGKINSFENTNYITVVSASNPGAPVQFTGFSMTASQLSTKGFTVYSSSLKQDYDIRGISWAEGYYFNIFITYDGDSTVSIYAVENGAIKSSRTNLNIEFHEPYFANNWTLKLLSTGVDSSNGADGQIDILRVYDTAFTEQDVLNNI